MVSVLQSIDCTLFGIILRDDPDFPPATFDRLLPYSSFTNEQVANTIYSELQPVVRPMFPSSFLRNLRRLAISDQGLLLVSHLLSKYLTIMLGGGAGSGQYCQYPEDTCQLAERVDLEMIQLLRERYTTKKRIGNPSGTVLQEFWRSMTQTRKTIAVNYAKLAIGWGYTNYWRRRKLNCDGIDPVYEAEGMDEVPDDVSVGGIDNDSIEAVLGAIDKVALEWYDNKWFDNESVEAIDDDSTEASGDITVGAIDNEAVETIEDGQSADDAFSTDGSRGPGLDPEDHRVYQACAVFAESIEFLRQWQSFDTGRMLAIHVCDEQLPDELLDMIATAFYQIGCHRDLLQHESCVEIARNDIPAWGPG